MERYKEQQELDLIEKQQQYKELLKEYWYIYSRTAYINYNSQQELVKETDNIILLNIMYKHLYKIDAARTLKEVFLIQRI